MSDAVTRLNAALEGHFMRRTVLGIVVTLLMVPYARAQVVPEEGDLVLLGGILWDGTADESRPNPGILVRNGTILLVGEVDPGVDPERSGAEVIRLEEDSFILPGLFDLHAHYSC